MDAPSAAPPARDAQTPGSPASSSDDGAELEPQLRYERLGADVKEILKTASATCLCLSEKILALGTSAGAVHVLDYAGNEVCVACCCCSRVCVRVVAATPGAHLAAAIQPAAHSRYARAPGW